MAGADWSIGRRIVCENKGSFSRYFVFGPHLVDGHESKVLHRRRAPLMAARRGVRRRTRRGWRRTRRGEHVAGLGGRSPGAWLVRDGRHLLLEVESSEK